MIREVAASKLNDNCDLINVSYVFFLPFYWCFTFGLFSYSKEYSSNSEQSLAYEASEDWFHSANEEFFLPYDVGTDVRFQLKNLFTN